MCGIFQYRVWKMLISRELISNVIDGKIEKNLRAVAGRSLRRLLDKQPPKTFFRQMSLRLPMSPAGRLKLALLTKI